MEEEIARGLEQIERKDEEIDRLVGERGRLVGQVLQAEERTRREIAQALHDDALQALLSAHQDLIEAAPGRSGVQRAHDVVGDAIRRVREAVVALHPVTLERGGLEQALVAIAGEAERRGGFSCSVRVERSALGEHDELVLAVARELLTNAAAHSDASRVSVEVARQDESIALEVADDGRGLSEGTFESAMSEGHVGLASVAQRLEAIGGRFEISGRARRRGTIARAVIPLVVG